MIGKFFRALRLSMETAPSLRNGAAFLPGHLKGKKLSGRGFKRVMANVGESLGLNMDEQVSNPFPAAYETGFKRQIVDYVFSRDGKPEIFLELETLDRAQLTTFRDPPGRLERNSMNKLWYYYVTLGERYRGTLRGPRFFAFLLILPDEPVGYYQIWDSKKDYQLLDPSRERLIRQSPFRFYDRRIKACARKFLQTPQKFPEPPDLESWTWKRPRAVQDLCELVFLTATRRELILSRGKDLFSPDAELRHRLRW